MWAFGIVDTDGPWGWRAEAGRGWWSTILPNLQDFESMTWEEIMRADGGGKKGNHHHHHFVSVEKLTRQAKTRLMMVGQDDVSELFSHPLAATARICGIRDRRALKLLW